MILVKKCAACNGDRSHAWDSARGQYRCATCHTCSWPDAPVVVPGETDEERARREGTARMLDLWRGAVRVVGEAVEREVEAIKARQREIAEERTGAIDPGVVPLPVLREEDVS